MPPGMQLRMLPRANFVIVRQPGQTPRILPSQSLDGNGDVLFAKMEGFYIRLCSNQKKHQQPQQPHLSAYKQCIALHYFYISGTLGGSPFLPLFVIADDEMQKMQKKTPGSILFSCHCFAIELLRKGMATSKPHPRSI